MTTTKRGAQKSLGAISYRPLTTADWPVVESLFGAKGACGGCWCQWPKAPRGGKQWEETRGAKARLALKKQIQHGETSAILAFSGSTPIGWACYGPRSVFPRLETVKAYALPKSDSVDSAKIISVVCFFVASGYRSEGIGTGMLKAALEEVRDAGGGVVEGYPTTTKSMQPAAFVWTGVEEMFTACGFEEFQRLSASKPVVRKTVRGKSRA